jgi:hypothetical protein
MVHVLELRLPVAEISAPYGERPEGSSSKLATYRDGFIILRLIGILVQRERPLEFFTTMAGLLALVSLILGVPVVWTFAETGLVPKLPMRPLDQLEETIRQRQLAGEADKSYTAKLLAGAEELDRWESKLKLLPPWLSFLGGLKMLRAVEGFAVTYWYYAQIDAIARTGKANIGIAPFSALLSIQKAGKAWLKARR